MPNAVERMMRTSRGRYSFSIMILYIIYLNSRYVSIAQVLKGGKFHKIDPGLMFYEISRGLLIRAIPKKIIWGLG
jgi:hypothetical protein